MEFLCGVLLCWLLLAVFALLGYALEWYWKEPFWLVLVAPLIPAIWVWCKLRDRLR